MSAEIEIRDTRNGSWYWVNTAVNACPHLDPIDKVVYGALASFAGFQQIKPTMEEIAKRASVAKRATITSIKTLEKQGLITVTEGGGRGNTNTYVLLKCPKGCTSCTVLERVHETTVKSAPRALDTIDIDKKDTYILKDSENENEPRSRVKADTSYKAVFVLFGGEKGWWNHKHQKDAAKRLLKNIPAVKYGISMMNENENDKMCPQAKTPWDFENKVPKLKEYLRRKNL